MSSMFSSFKKQAKRVGSDATKVSFNITGKGNQTMYEAINELFEMIVTRT